MRFLKNSIKHLFLILTRDLTFFFEIKRSDFRWLTIKMCVFLHIKCFISFITLKRERFFVFSMFLSENEDAFYSIKRKS